MEKKNPVLLSVIGWGTIIIGGLSVFSSIVNMILYSSFQNRFAEMLREMPNAFPTSLKPILNINLFFVKNAPFIFPLIIIFSGILIYIGIELLKRKNWSRIFFEVFSVLSIIYIIAFSILYLIFMNKIFPAQNISSNSITFMKIFMIIILIFVDIINAGSLILAIIYLESKKIKELFQ